MIDTVLTRQAPKRATSAPGKPITNPRTEAIAYRIWAWCRECEWRTNLLEIADELKLDVNVARGVIQSRGWSRRLGGVTKSGVDGGRGVMSGFVDSFGPSGSDREFAQAFTRHLK